MDKLFSGKMIAYCIFCIVLAFTAMMGATFAQDYNKTTGKIMIDGGVDWSKIHLAKGKLFVRIMNDYPNTKNEKDDLSGVRKRFLQGVVFATGEEEKRLGQGDDVIRKGDKILFPIEAGYQFKLGNKSGVLLDEKEILAKVATKKGDVQYIENTNE